jgi:2-amino-4-hydroxy-6-hydroxymethyldihydropteridine diphosphokinase
VTTAYVGIGSNLEQPREQVLQAMTELDAIPGTKVQKRSSLYRTAPLGHAAQPDFINAVAEVATDLTAEALLAALQAIESRHARKRSFPNAPRTLDLDLLLYGDAELASERLTLPHPRMHERAFVLAPLVEIAPGASIPGAGSARECLSRCSLQPVERIA